MGLAYRCELSMKNVTCHFWFLKISPQLNLSVEDVPLSNAFLLFTLYNLAPPQLLSEKVVQWTFFFANTPKIQCTMVFLFYFQKRKNILYTYISEVMSKSFLHTAPNRISSTNMTVSDTFITYLMAFSDELAEIFTDIFLPYQKFLHTEESLLT